MEFLVSAERTVCREDSRHTLAVEPPSSRSVWIGRRPSDGGSAPTQPRATHQAIEKGLIFLAPEHK